ncbi:MAG TPA: response regulator [Opitutaceae bacterium]|nr:response regulator [Opitutaceae bacterium]
MQSNILLVDDDERVLAGCQRLLRKQFLIQTAKSGEEALERLKSPIKFSVVVADMQMPGMDGLDLLRRAKAVAPETVRIMLTGNHDLKTAVDAVNSGQVFRFLQKPCSNEIMGIALQDGVHHYQLQAVERELMEKTLNGAVKILLDVLAVVDPSAFGRSQKLRNDIQYFLKYFVAEKFWELDLAAMLSQIGRVTLPPTVIAKERSREELSVTEKDMVRRVPEIGASLLEKIPRLGNVAHIVRLQTRPFAGYGFSMDEIKGKDLPLGARILRILGDLADLESEGLSRRTAALRMRKMIGAYDPEVLAAVIRVFELSSAETEVAQPIASVRVQELRPGQVLAEDIKTFDGVPLILSGAVLSALLIERLENFYAVGKIQSSYMVMK